MGHCCLKLCCKFQCSLFLLLPFDFEPIKYWIYIFIWFIFNLLFLNWLEWLEYFLTFWDGLSSNPLAFLISKSYCLFLNRFWCILKTLSVVEILIIFTWLFIIVRVIKVRPALFLSKMPILVSCFLKSKGIWTVVTKWFWKLFRFEIVFIY